MKAMSTGTDTILLCLATRKGFEVLKALENAFPEIKFVITTFRENNVVESYNEKIRVFSQKQGYRVHSWQDIKFGGSSWLRDNSVYAVFCVGWRYMLPPDVIDAVEGRIIIAHDSLLPKYRGFAPLPSALINGENEVGVTVLFAAEQVDAGDVLYQGKISVGKKDRIADLIDGVSVLYSEGIVQAVQRLVAGNLQGEPQDHQAATYSIWRDTDDLEIDWSQSAERIERTIRALGPPYLGAYSYINGNKVIINEAEVLEDVLFEIRQPGKVWSVTSKGGPVVVCGKGMLVVCKAQIGKDSLVPTTKLRVRFGK